MVKAAVDQPSRTAACELSPHCIRVTVVHPKLDRYARQTQFFFEEELQSHRSTRPWGRLARPDEIARGVVFLCDRASEYTTGATLSIDGELLPHNQTYRITDRHKT